MKQAKRAVNSNGSGGGDRVILVVTSDRKLSKNVEATGITSTIRSARLDAILTQAWMEFDGLNDLRSPAECGFQVPEKLSSFERCVCCTT